MSEPDADAEDAAFLAAFESCTLPRPDWTHAAHLRMAYLYLRRDDTPDADAWLPTVRQRIRAYNESLGNSTGYHDTVTAAFLRLVADRLRRTPSPTFAGFRQANPDLFAARPGGLSTHYTPEVLRSPEARARFIEPNIAPLP